MTKVKICGLTNPQDAITAEQKGAHCLGMIFSDSKRKISLDIGREIVRQVSPFTLTAGVFVNESLSDIANTTQQVELDIIQLHGDEPPEFAVKVKQITGLKVLKAFRIKDENSLADLQNYHCDGYLLDGFSQNSYGGSGKRFDLNLFPKDSQHNDGNGNNPHYILAGGLTPENVSAAVSEVNPAGVCVSSGVESESGVKSAQKIEKFINNVQKGSDLKCKTTKDILENTVENLSQKHLWVP